jgi:hypothetical protein
LFLFLCQRQEQYLLKQKVFAPRHEAKTSNAD